MKHVFVVIEDLHTSYAFGVMLRLSITVSVNTELFKHEPFTYK